MVKLNVWLECLVDVNEAALQVYKCSGLQTLIFLKALGLFLQPNSCFIFLFWDIFTFWSNIHFGGLVVSFLPNSCF